MCGMRRWEGVWQCKLNFLRLALRTLWTKARTPLQTSDCQACLGAVLVLRSFQTLNKTLTHPEYS